jgi:Leucine-rich repeat (LRR) protein
LSLQNTPLERIGQFTFSGLHNLTSLYLSNNQIRRIESYAFAGTSTIRLLVLTNNPTVRIDSSAFAGMFSNLIDSMLLLLLQKLSIQLIEYIQIIIVG